MALERDNNNNNHSGDSELHHPHGEYGIERGNVATNVRVILADIRHYAELVGFDLGDFGHRLVPLFEQCPHRFQIHYE